MNRPQTEKLLELITGNIKKGNGPLVREFVRSCLDLGMDATHIRDGVTTEVGTWITTKLAANEIRIEDVIIAARTMNDGLKDLTLKGPECSESPSAGVLLGTGVKLVDLGQNVSGQQLARAINRHRPNMAVITGKSHPKSQDAVKLLLGEGSREDVTVLIGSSLSLIICPDGLNEPDDHCKRNPGDASDRLLN